MHFKRLPAWAQIICLLAVAFVVTWGFWMALRDTLCAVDATGFLIKRPTTGACFEFWLNRYQSLIGGVLALIGAALTIRMMMHQMNANARSNENAARVFAYASLREFISAASSAIDSARHFDEGYLKDSTAEFEEHIPEFELKGDIHILGHLPEAIVKEIFHFRNLTSSVPENISFLRKKNIPALHVYVDAGMCRHMLMADDLSQKIAKPLGLYMQAIEDKTRVAFEERKATYEGLETYDDVCKWLRNEHQARKDKIASP